MVFVVGFYYFIDQVCGGGEVYGEFFLISCQFEVKGDMCFVCVIWVEGNDVFVMVDLFVVGQFQYLYFVEFWNGVEVEVVEVFDCGEFGGFDVVFDYLLFLVNQFQFDEVGKVVDMVYVFGCVLLGQFLMFVQECWQFQGFEVMGEQDFWGVVYVVFFVLFDSSCIQDLGLVLLIVVCGRQGQQFRFSWGGWCLIW